MINIDELIKDSMKSKNKAELRAYKSLKAEIQLLKTAKNAKPYDEVAEIQLISKICKKLEDGILDFSEAGREDLVSEYRDELEVLKKLLPEPIKTEDILVSLSEWCVKNNFCSETEEFIMMPKETKNSGKKIELPKKEMGNAIKYLKSKFPQADGKMISEIVKGYVI